MMVFNPAVVISASVATVEGRIDRCLHGYWCRGLKSNVSVWGDRISRMSEFRVNCLG